MDLPILRSNRPAAPDVLPARPWLQRAARLGLWSLLIAAAVGGTSGLLMAASPAQAPTPSSPATEPVPPSVVSFAEHAVRQWLSIDHESSALLAATFVDPPPIDRSLTTGRNVVSVSGIEAITQQDEYWAVTVAAVFGPVTPEAPPDTWYFEIGIVQAGSGLMAAGAPALVAGPVPASESLPSPVALGTPDRANEVTATVDGFFRAMLAGGGDISRYLSPGTAIPAVFPAPFSRTEVTGETITPLEPDGVRVRVEIQGIALDDTTWTLAYEISLAQRDERWEVTALTGAPALAARAPQPTTSRSAPTSTSTTVTVAPEPGA